MKFLISAFIIFITCIQLQGQRSASEVELRRQASVMEWTDVEGAIEYWLKEYDGTKAQGDLNYRAQVALILSKAYNVRRDAKNIELWNERASELYTRIGDRRGQAEVLYQKGFIEFCGGEYEEAMDFVLKGLAIMESLGDEEGIGLGYLRMTRLFHFTAKMAESAEYGKLGGEKLEKAGALIEAADAWSFGGHGYRMMKDSLNASMAFNRSLNLAQESRIPSVLSLAYNDLASFHMEFNAYEEAEKYFIKSLEIIKAEDERQIMVIKNGLSQVYLHTGRFEECIRVSKEALSTVRKTNDIFFLSEIPEYIAKSYKGLQQYDSAYKYMELNWLYTDSLFTVNQEQALEEMQTKYETEKKERIIDRQKREQLFGGALLIALGGIVALLIRAYRSKNKLNVLLEERNEEKDFLLKEIHHRVKNNLQILSSLLSLQSNEETDSTVLSALQESKNRVESMGLIHQRLYTRDNVIAINMKDYINDLSEYLKESFISVDQSVNILSKVSVGLVDVESAIPIGLIINELVTNSVKYGLIENDDAEIRIELRMTENELLELTVSDNGQVQSNPLENKNSTNFGSQLVGILSKKLKGKVTVDRNKGYATTIVFHRFSLAS